MSSEELMAGQRMSREDGALVSRGLIRIAKDNIDVPLEQRHHPGAGVVTWILIDGTWRIYKAEGRQ